MDSKLKQNSKAKEYRIWDGAAPFWPAADSGVEAALQAAMLLEVPGAAMAAAQPASAVSHQTRIG